MLDNTGERPLVFIHGAGDTARVWRSQVDYFGPARAFAIDVPGHGQRADTLPQKVSVLDYARAAHDIIRDELHLDHPVIAGHSLGGAVALVMGLEYGDEMGGLILISSGARLRVHPDLLEEARTAPEGAIRRLKGLGFTPEHGAMIDGIIAEQATPPDYMLYRDLAACNAFDCMARLAEIRLPALIICGVEDRVSPVKYSQYLHEHIPGSSLRLIPDAGHYVIREQPQQVNRAIEEWLA